MHWFCRIYHLVGVFTHSRLCLHILQDVDQSILVLVCGMCWNRPISSDVFQKGPGFFMYSCLSITTSATPLYAVNTMQSLSVLVVSVPSTLLFSGWVKEDGNA